MNPIVLQTPEEMISTRATLFGKSIGFVPTMGALHRGHAELLKQARTENEICILSIFVNPTQFNDKKDLDNYPQAWQSDFNLAKENQVDYIFLPTYQNIYPDQYRFKIIETDFSKSLCGKSRPGHFDGVLTVVMKLLSLTGPTRAYFGEKDYQQLRLIKEMVAAFFLPTEIIAVPTVRESDGLAMSSRNVRLSPVNRQIAPTLYHALTKSATAEVANSHLQNAGFQVDYVTDFNNRRYAAARLGEVRLIDNVTI